MDKGRVQESIEFARRYLYRAEDYLDEDGKLQAIWNLSVVIENCVQAIQHLSDES